MIKFYLKFSAKSLIRRWETSGKKAGNLWEDHPFSKYIGNIKKLLIFSVFAAYRLLPTAYRLLPTERCLPPTAY
jgi:hypothetical protein